MEFTTVTPLISCINPGSRWVGVFLRWKLLGSTLKTAGLTVNDTITTDTIQVLYYNVNQYTGGST